MQKAIVTINLISFILGVGAVDSNIFLGILAVINILIIAIIEGVDNG